MHKISKDLKEPLTKKLNGQIKWIHGLIEFQHAPFLKSQNTM
jgi:hypothetical protein